MRRWLGRLALVFVGLGFGAVVAEFGARAMEPRGASDLLFNSPDNSPVGLYVGSRELFSVPSPGFAATISSLGYSVPLRINSHGLRGPEVEAKTRSRWLAIGDSFTFAAQVSEERGFHALLGEEAPGVEVLNAGVDGYGTWQARRRYELLAPGLDLDGVLLVFFTGNDFSDNERWPQMKNMAAGFADGEPLPRFTRDPFTRLLARYSYLYGRLQIRRAAAELERGGGRNYQRFRSELETFHAIGQGRLQQQMEASRRELRDLRNATRQAGQQLLVAVAPPAFAVVEARTAPTLALVGLDPSGARPDAPGDALVSMLRAERIPDCDLAPALKAAEQSGQETYLQYDGHWTEQGHVVVAQALAACWPRRR